MNILIFSPTWPKKGNANGIVTYCFNLVSALKNLGHDVHILTFHVMEETEEFVYPVSYKPSFLERLWLRIYEKFSPGYSQYYLGAKAIVAGIRNIEKQQHIDVMEIEESFGWHYYVQKKVSFPVVMRLHGPHFISAAASGKKLQEVDFCRFQREEKAFKAAKYVNAPSHWALNEVKQKCGVSWEVEGVFYNPIGLVEKPHCWGVDTYNKHQILFVGRFDYLKGGDVVLKAFVSVLNSIPEAKLVFVGPDRGINESNGEVLYIDDYIDLIVPEVFRGSIQYRGLLEKHEIERLRQESHITIAASRSEVFGYTVLEALASGSPIIACSVGGVEEIVEDNNTGMLFGINDIDILASKIVTLLNDSDLIKTIAENGYSSCGEKFSNDRVGREAAKYFSQVIDVESKK